MNPGIYQIRNIITGDLYIGSTCSIKDRWYRHKKDLKTQKHHSIILQRAWDKYGDHAFVFEVLERCVSYNLCIREDYYLQLYKPIYNIHKIAYSSLGCKQSEETKEKKRLYAITNNIRPPKSTYDKIRKSIIMLDYSTLKELKEFISISDACKYLGKDERFATTLTSVCNGKRYSAFGYRWKFKGDPNPTRKKKPLVAWNKGGYKPI